MPQRAGNQSVVNCRGGQPTPFGVFKILKDPDSGALGTSARGEEALGAYPVNQHCNYDYRPNGVGLCATVRHDCIT